MKDNGERKLDELFRQSLEQQPQLPFEEEHWLNMHERLSKNSRKRYFYTGLALGGAAAVLLIMLSLWIFQPVLTIEPGAIVKSPRADSSQTQNKTEATSNKSPVLAENNLRGSTADAGANTADKGKTATHGVVTANAVKKAPVLIAVNDPAHAVSIPPEISDQLLIAPTSSNTRVDDMQISFAGLSGSDLLISRKDPEGISEPDDQAPPKKVRFNRTLTLGILASPDFNAVHAFKNNKGAFSGGLTATFSLSPLISITTGAILAHKVYEADYKYYKPSGSGYRSPTATNVDASCKVLDIPLNINYSVLSKGSNHFLISAGASSYFMLTEDYKINYAGTRAPYKYHLDNENRHYFGIANLGVIYQKKINNTTGFSVQPYVKLPLTTIGYGKVKLISSGIAASLNMDLLSSGKSKISKP